MLVAPNSDWAGQLVLKGSFGNSVGTFGKTHFPTWAVTWLVLTSVFALRFLYLATRPAQTLVTLIPDDAFYYLKLADSFAQHGIWSVDGGATQTTGFQPLFAYLLAAASLFVHGRWPMVHAALVINALAYIGAAALTCRFLETVFGRLGSLGAIPVFLSRASLFACGSAMEWALPVLATSACFSLIFDPREQRISRSRFLLAFGVGVFGSLARSDFMGVPAAIFVVSAAHWVLCRRGRTPAQLGLAVFGGAMAGLAILSLHNYILSGHFIQTSVRVKILWSATLQYFSLKPALKLSWGASGLQLPKKWYFLAALALLLAGVYVKRRRVFSFIRIADISLPSGSALAVCSLYLLIHARNPAIQGWYTATSTVSLAVLWAFLVTLVREAVLPRIVYAGAMLVFLGLTASNVLTSTGGIYPQQTYMYQASQYLKTNPLPGQLAAWNSGILGYFCDQHIINLDGLVNDDIYEYTRRKDILGYLEKMQIEYIIDFPAMFEVDFLAMRGGFSDGNLRTRLKAIKVFRSNDRRDFWIDLTVWKLLPRTVSNATFRPPGSAVAQLVPTEEVPWGHRAPHHSRKEYAHMFFSSTGHVSPTNGSCSHDAEESSSPPGRQVVGNSWIRVETS
jgi:hypothetical protein